MALELNECREWFPRKYANVAQIVRQLNFMASGDPISYRVEPSDEYPWESKRRFMKSGFIVHDEHDPRVATIGTINARLAKYLSVPVVSLTEGRPDLYWHSADHVGHLVNRIARLVQSGLLNRVRECKQCKDWFYANRISKIFCTALCSKLNWQSSSEGRESRRFKMREYMRKRRKQEKEELPKGVRRGL